jgi:hypothetical protein
MGWYSARIIFETDIEGPPDPTPMCEESIRVLLAESEEAAWKKAESVGRSGEHAYNNDTGELVRWRYKCVAEIQELYEETLYDGVEVYSRLFPSPVGGPEEGGIPDPGGGIPDPSGIPDPG